MAEKFSKELNVALSASKDSAEILKKFYSKKLDVEIKHDGTIVTQADKLSEKKNCFGFEKIFSAIWFFG